MVLEDSVGSLNVEGSNLERTGIWKLFGGAMLGVVKTSTP
jgi:hypothetical protein